MSSDDERDYEEENYNRRWCEHCGEAHADEEAAARAHSVQEEDQWA